MVVGGKDRKSQTPAHGGGNVRVYNSDILPIIMDTRCEKAIRFHAEKMGFESGSDAWSAVRNETMTIYRFLHQTVPNLYGREGEMLIDAPINDCTIHPLTSVRGVGVVFMMTDTLTEPGVRVAATFWIAGNAIVF